MAQRVEASFRSFEQFV